MTENEGQISPIRRNSEKEAPLLTKVEGKFYDIRDQPQTIKSIIILRD